MQRMQMKRRGSWEQSDSGESVGAIRNRVTIPKQIRDSLGLKKGDVVDARLEGNCVVIMPRKLASPEAWAKLLVGISYFRTRYYTSARLVFHSVSAYLNIHFCRVYGFLHLLYLLRRVVENTRKRGVVTLYQQIHILNHNLQKMSSIFSINLDVWSNSQGRCLHPKPKGLGFDTET